MTSPRFLTIDQAAGVLGVNRSFVERRVSDFGAIRAGRVYRIPVASFEEWIAANRVPSPSRFPARKRSASLDRQLRAEEVRSLKAAVLGR